MDTHTHSTLSTNIPRLASDSFKSRSNVGAKREQSGLKELADAQIEAHAFTFHELVAATNNFRPESFIGEGRFGRVYKGRLQTTGQVVAVKQLDGDGVQGNREFLVEVLMLSLLHHSNLVNLIGYCADEDQRLLVYEFMPLGSLEDRLHDIPPEKEPLDWNTRMKIAAGAAKGLEFLHDKASPPVIYKDFKSSNLLLGEGFHTKLSDFGLAKLHPNGDKSHVSTNVMGTYGYYAPEYAMTGQLTVKSDVYSFGVVILELITGRKAIDSTQPQELQNLVTWARPLFNDRRKFEKLVDPMLQGQYPVQGLYQALVVAFMCIQEQAAARPLIGDVANALSYLANQAYDSSLAPGHGYKLNGDRDEKNNRASGRFLKNVTGGGSGPKWEVSRKMGCFLCFGSKVKEMHKDSHPTSDKVKSSSTFIANKKKADSKKQVFDQSPLQIFTFRELAAAANNFRAESFIGEGGYGCVYKGMLKNTGQVVAVKQLDIGGHQGTREFLVEVLMSSLLRHSNLVNLIGYCADGDQRLIVYEFMPLGSLEHHLHDLSPDKEPLDWKTRMKIAAGAAKGLEYLHDKADRPIIYRDLKSSNILLGEGFHPKLSDFGLAKLGPVGDVSYISEQVAGTYGYWAPDYAKTGKLTVQSDVYSFGVVLLELITGRKAFDNTRPQGQRKLVAWARHLFVDQRKFAKFADPRLQGQYPMRGLYQALAVASMCIQEEGAARPPIRNVVAALSNLATHAYELSSATGSRECENRGDEITEAV